MSQRMTRTRLDRTNKSQASQAIESSQNEAGIAELVKNCVRFFVTRMHTNVPIKRALVLQHVFGARPGRTVDVVLKKTKAILKEVYGLKLEVADAGTANKKYFLSNALEHPELIETNPLEDVKTTITFLVLTHIFMSKNSAVDVSLWAFLKEFELSLEDEIDGVGTVQSFITKTLVKQQFVACDTSGAQHDDGESKRTFSWGSRAEESVSKMEILKFVSKMHDKQNIKSWSAQYADAKEQFDDTEPDEDT